MAVCQNQSEEIEMKKGQKRISFGLCLAVALLCGCGQGKTGEVSVPQVSVAEQPEVHQTEEQAAAALELETPPGTVLGEEEVIVMEGDSPKSVMYNRVLGMEGSSIAYDPERFTMETAEGELRFLSNSDPKVLFTMQQVEGDSAETLAEQYIYESNQECTMEEVTVGEGEYPAIWVNYATGTEAEDQIFDLYVLRYNERLYVVRLECTVDLYETEGAREQMILSTLRFDEG